MLITDYRLLQRRKERGRIAVESVHVVETASLGNGSTGGGVGDAAGGGDTGGGGGSGGVPSGLPFQVGYREAGQEYTLYLLATREQDRAEWIRAIRAGKLAPSRPSVFPFTFPLHLIPFIFPLHSIAVWSSERVSRTLLLSSPTTETSVILSTAMKFR